MGFEFTIIQKKNTKAINQSIVDKKSCIANITSGFAVIFNILQDKLQFISEISDEFFINNQNLEELNFLQQQHSKNYMKFLDLKNNECVSESFTQFGWSKIILNT